MATYDAVDVAKKRDFLVTRMTKGLDETAGNVVGIAYAVGGKVVGARWFASHKLFGNHRGALLATVAMEAINAKATRRESVAPDAVSEFVSGLRKQKANERRKTAARNDNVYKKNAEGRSAECTVEGVEVTSDYLLY